MRLSALSFHTASLETLVVTQELSFEALFSRVGFLRGWSVAASCFFWAWFPSVF